MVSPLEKTRKDPESVKAKILMAACRIFGAFGFHGTTMRMVAQTDISTLHYHWGDKRKPSEAVVLGINHDLGHNLISVEKMIQGLPLQNRWAIFLDYLTAYLFAHPKIFNLLFFHYSDKTRNKNGSDFKIPELHRTLPIRYDS
jgi:TetR/AcrR family transcriptional regulator, regulator of cefoperazone and chloramphenicol sensitivity